MSTIAGHQRQVAKRRRSIEANDLYGRLGYQFLSGPNTRTKTLTVLYSKSNQYYQKKDHNREWPRGDLPRREASAVPHADDRSKKTCSTVPWQRITRRVILTGLAHLDPPIVAALEAFVRDGGTILETSDCTVPSRAPSGFPSTCPTPGSGRTWRRSRRSRIPREAERAVFAPRELPLPGRKCGSRGRCPQARATPGGAQAGVPQRRLDHRGRQAGARRYRVRLRGQLRDESGIEGLPSAGLGAPVPATARIIFIDDGRPVSDADDRQASRPPRTAARTVAFVPGQMVAAFARPSRAIGGLQVSAPVVSARLHPRRRSAARPSSQRIWWTPSRTLIAGNAPMEDPR